MNMTCSSMRLGLGVEPLADLGEVGDARQHRRLAVAIDHHGARQLAGPGRIDLVAQALVEAVGEGPALGLVETGTLPGLRRRRSGSCGTGSAAISTRRMSGRAVLQRRPIAASRPGRARRSGPRNGSPSAGRHGPRAAWPSFRARTAGDRRLRRVPNEARPSSSGEEDATVSWLVSQRDQAIAFVLGQPRQVGALPVGDQQRMVGGVRRSRRRCGAALQCRPLS